MFKIFFIDSFQQIMCLPTKSTLLFSIYLIKLLYNVMLEKHWYNFIVTRQSIQEDPLGEALRNQPQLLDGV